ncbi:hypothetical protein JCM5353_004582 [Sporobolomyces roseus]
MEGLKQSTLDFSKGQVRISSRSPSLEVRPSPEIPSTTNKRSKRKPVTQSFDHGKHRQQDGYVSDGQEVSESEEEAKLETLGGRKQVKVSSDEDQSGTEDEESEEVDSEEMLDLEASDDEDYQSGDSLDEDEGGNRRRKKKDKGKGKRKRRESTDDSEIEVVEPKKKVGKGKKRKVIESDESDVQIVEQPVASTSRANSSQTPLSPACPSSLRKRPPSSFLGVEVPPRTNSKSPSATPVRRSPTKPNKKSSKSKLASTHDSEDFDSPPPRLPSSSTSKSKGKRRAVVESSSSAADSASDSSPFEEPESLRKDRKKRQKRSRADSSTSPKKKRNKKKKLGRLSQGVKDRRSADESSESEGESESNFFVVDDDVEESSEWSESERERLLGEHQARRRRREEEEIRERDKEEIRRRRLAAKEKGNGKEKAVEIEADEDEDEPVRSGRRIEDRGKGKAKEKKSKSKSKKGKSKKVVEESEVSEEEEEDLGIDGEETVVDQRLRTTKSSMASKFEQLRAARQSKLGSSSQQPIVIDSSNEGSASPAPARRTGPRYAGGSESDANDSGNDSATSEQDDQSQHDVDSDDFIASDGEIEDDEEAQREIEKIRSRAQGFNYYLKNYLLYLVHLIVVPEADWLAADEEFREAQSRVEGRLQGVVSSGVQSGGWKPDFQAIIDSRPNFDHQDLTGNPPCDACSAGEHRRATFVGTFSGPRYDRTTLKELETSNEESSSSSSSSSDDDSEDGDHPLSKPQKTSTRKNKKKNRRRKDRDREFTFNLGNFCAGRCIAYHELRHWPYTTRQKLARKVRPLLDSTISPAEKKKGMSPEEWLSEQRRVRRAKEADASRIGESLDRKGVIKDVSSAQ